MKRTIAAAAFASLAFAGAASAQNEQFIPTNFYCVRPYAPGGSGFGGGIIDYFSLINERDGGINGVKLTWEKCETEYNNARGVECYERSKKNGPTGATVTNPALLKFIIPGTLAGLFLGSWFSMMALARMPGGVATALMSCSPIFMIPLTRLFFGERHSARAMAGTAVTVAGVFVLLA